MQQTFVTLLQCILESSSIILCRYYKSTLECFEDVVTAIGLAYELYSQQQQNNDNHDMDLMLGDDIEEVETDLMKQLSELQQKLEDCCKELAILGFNSLSYNIN